MKPDPFKELRTRDEAKEHVVSREVLNQAVEAWAANREPLYHHSLAYAITRRMWSFYAAEWEGSHPFDRAADNMVQRLKVAGLIERMPHARGWRLTDQGRRSIINAAEEPQP